jgi:hypothetical protein
MENFDVGLYGLFCPLVRVKGHLFKMNRFKMSNYPRYIYLNPIEGKLVSYKTANKFPHSPNYVMSLNEITELEYMDKSKWYFKKGQYYFTIGTKEKKSVFFDDNLQVIKFWVE